MRRQAPRAIVTSAALALLAALAAPWAAPAQEAAPPRALRIAVDLSSQVEGAAEQPNSLHYYVWERLHHFGVRADSRRPVGDARYDGYIAKMDQKWAQREPEAPAATLVVSGAASCEYATAEFFGQPQAHNFSGRIEVALKDEAGAALATIAYGHSWGRLPGRYTKSQTLREYQDMVATTLVIAILSHERVRAGLAADKRAAAKTWCDEQRARILKPLEENMGDCDIAKLLRGLAEADAPAKD